MNLLNYDEFVIHADFDDDTLKLPSVWQPDWPDLSVTAVTTLMSSLLHQTCIVPGGHICINALEHDMVFQTYMNFVDPTIHDHPEKCFIVKNIDTTFTIITAPNAATNTESSEGKKDVTYTAPYMIPFMTNAFNKLNKIQVHSLLPPPNKTTNDVLESSRRTWLGAHSCLLNSSPGSGKTYLLNSLVSDLKAKFSYERMKDGRDDSLFVFFLSGAGIDTLSTSSESLNATPLTLSRDDAYPALRILEVLTLFVKSLPRAQEMGATDLDNNLHESKLQQIADIVSKGGHLPSVCVVIDNADSLVQVTGESSSSSPLDVSNETKLASHYLKELLALLTTPTCNHSLCVLAATSITVQSDLAPEFRGPPGFETTVTMPLPSFEDRCLLLKVFFEEYCDSKDLETVLGELPMRFVSHRDKYINLDDESDDNVDDKDIQWNKQLCKSSLVYDWITRAGSLTAGYLPTDLRQIIKKAWGIACSRDDVNLSSTDITSIEGDSIKDGESKLLWTDFLGAVAVTIPTQLRSVAMSEGGGSGGIIVESRDSTLSWSNFAGYAEEKESISQILERSNPFYGKRKTKQETHAKTELCRAVGHHAPKGLVLYGPSGCGKSHMARIIAAEVESTSFTHIAFSSLD